MWVVLVVQILNKALDHGHVHALQKKLQEIPDNLNELFRSILTRDGQNMDEMKLCLQWILFANQPLKREELYFAIMAGIEPQELRPWDSNEVIIEIMDRFILSSSKGMAEITKSKHQTVQFIHESVREFLLKQDKLDQLRTDPKDSSVGSSHDRLKECCSNYLKTDITGYLDMAGPLASVNPSEASALREKASGMFPFLEYAVRNIFIHANFSHAGCVDQASFINEFEFGKWIQLHNIIERYKIRRLPPDISILYVLAEKNCSSLIDIRMQGGFSIQGRNGRYGHPIFAIIANDHQQAFEALVNGYASAGVNGSAFGSSVGICSFLVKHGKSALVHRFLSAFKVDPNLKTKGGESMISWAIKNRKEKIVEVLASQGADLDTALCTASAYGHLEVVQVLLDQGVDINAQSGKYSNALCMASTFGLVEVVQLLLDRGANVNAQDEGFGNALFAASAQGYHVVVQLLLGQGADSNAPFEDYGNALYIASERGHVKVVQSLLDGGACINAEGGLHDNALCGASACGHREVVQLLLDRGANINAQNSGYGNALCAASARHHTHIVDLLLSQGANASAQTGQYGNALQAALTHSLDDNIYLSSRSNNYVVNLPNHLPWHYLRSSGVAMNALQDYQMQLMFLEEQNKKTLLAARSETPDEMEKRFSSHLIILELLINKVDDVNMRGGKYGTPLQAASVLGSVKAVSLLLDRGSDINIQGGKYGSALKAARVLGHQRVIQLLSS